MGSSAPRSRERESAALLPRAAARRSGAQGRAGRPRAAAGQEPVFHSISRRADWRGGSRPSRSQVRLVGLAVADAGFDDREAADSSPVTLERLSEVVLASRAASLQLAPTSGVGSTPRSSSEDPNERAILCYCQTHAAAELLAADAPGKVIEKVIADQVDLPERQAVLLQSDPSLQQHGRRFRAAQGPAPGHGGHLTRREEQVQAPAC